MAYWMIAFAALGGLLTLIAWLLGYRKLRGFLWVLLGALTAAAAVPLTGCYMVKEWVLTQDWSGAMDCVPAMAMLFTWYLIFIVVVNGISVFLYCRKKK